MVLNDFEINELNNNFNINSTVVGLIQKDLKIENVDSELTQIYDPVDEKFININLDDIIDATLRRVKKVIFSYKNV